MLAIGLVAWNTYASWREGPWELPAPVTSKPAPEDGGNKQIISVGKTTVSTDAIVSKNLFDPERGAGATREAEETSRAYQRIRGMILIGTVVMGNTRTAILQESSAANINPAAQAQTPTTMRLRVGDNVEGYRLTEIGDKRVVFAKDATRVEIALDYFRKVEVAAPRPPVAPGQVITPGTVPQSPRVVPNLPRRSRIPVPGTPNSDS